MTNSLLLKMAIEIVDKNPLKMVDLSIVMSVYQRIWLHFVDRRPRTTWNDLAVKIGFGVQLDA